MNDGIVTRRAEPADAEGILRAREAAIRGKASASYKPEEIAGWIAESPITPDSIDRHKKIVGDENAYTHVAEKDGAIVGFSTVVPKDNVLLRVFVAPSDWRGLGQRLLERAEDDARAYGVEYLDCEASVNAERFYARNGYEVIERGMYRMQCGLQAPCVRMKKYFRK